MNLRTLKKLSKRAAPLLKALGDTREQFKSASWDNYHGCFIGDRKHWERGRCHPTYEGRNDWTTPRGAEIVFTTRAGNRVVMSPPVHPRKGTVMVGCMSGYYEPEWDEECAWSALDTQVRAYFVEWNDDDLVPTKSFKNPSEILQGARDILKEMQNAKH